MSLFKVNILSDHAMQSVASSINDIIHCYEITDILIDFAVFQSKWILHTSIADSLQPKADISLVHILRRLPFKLRHAHATACRFTINRWVHVPLAVVNTRQTKQLLRSVLSNQYYYIKAAYNKTVLRALKQRSYTIRPVTVIVHICKPVYFTRVLQPLSVFICLHCNDQCSIVLYLYVCLHVSLHLYIRVTTSLIMSLFKVNVLSQHGMQSLVNTIKDIIHSYNITNILIDFAVFQSKWDLHTSIADSLQPTPDITLLHLRVRRRLPFKRRHAQATVCRFTIKHRVHVPLAVVNTRETKQLLRSLLSNQYYYIKAA